MPKIKRTPIITDKKSFNFKPSPNRVIPNDKLSQMIPNLPNAIKVNGLNPIGEEMYKECMKKDLGFTVLEASTAKHGNIMSEVKLSLNEGYTDTTPLDQFDKEVLIACMSEQQYGNAATTVDAIFRNITGLNEPSRPSPQMREEILHSIRKLRHHDIRINMSKICDVRKNYTPSDGPIIESAILPGWVLEKAIINGIEVSDVIKFDRPSPIFIIAQAKKQLFSYARCMLNDGGIVNSKQNIMLKNYIQQRIEAIKHHPRKTNENGKSFGLYSTITFKDLYEHLRVDADTTVTPQTIEKRKQSIRQTACKFLYFLQETEVIAGYTIVKEGKKWIAINLTI